MDMHQRPLATLFVRIQNLLLQALVDSPVWSILVASFDLCRWSERVVESRREAQVPTASCVSALLGLVLNSMQFFSYSAVRFCFRRLFQTTDSVNVISSGLKAIDG